MSHDFRELNANPRIVGLALHCSSTLTRVARFVQNWLEELERVVPR